jgi:hypothetical protein
MTSSTGSLLQSIQILVTGVPEKEKRRLHDIARSQGAVILSTANANDPPHVVITRTVGSPRYFTILKRNANIPIVTPEWLTSSIEKNTRLPYADFAAGVFQGLVICFSGLSVPEKKEFSEQVEAEGGRHSPVLDRTCTHLVTDSTQSDKFIYAQLNGIYTITPAWIEESLSAGRCLDPTKYLITKPVGSQHHSQQQTSHLIRQASLQRTGQRGEGAAAGAGGSGLTGDVTENGLDSNTMTAKEQGGKVDGSRRSGSEEPSLRKVAVDTTTAARGEKSSSRLGTTAGAGVGGEADVPISATPATGVTPTWTTLDHEDDAPLFLDSCFIWVTCCSAAEEQETLVLCAHGGAKRFLEPHPTLTTHIVVGSNLTGENAQTVVAFSNMHKDVPVVNLEWLRRSAARREVLAADERFTVTLPTSTTTAAGAGGTGGARLLGNGGGSMSLLGFNDSNSLPVIGLANNNKETAAAGGGDLNGDAAAYLLNRQNSSAAHSLMGGFLDNCYFTLAAVRGTPEGDAAERLIRMHGGRIFSTSAPTSGKACFAICPYSLPPNKVNALRKSHPDFAAVPETQRFTLWWLECSVQAGEVLPATPGTACFQPLPFTLPLKDMDKVSVSISGYEPSVRAAIQRTVEIVGGRVSLEYMTAKDTHLIVPVANGKKYKYAARYGVIPVTAAWLLESVKAGKALPPNNFAPLLPEGGIPAKDDVSQQQHQHPLPTSSLLPIGTQQTYPQSAGGGATGGRSLYAAAIAGPSSLRQTISNTATGGAAGAVNAKPTLKQKAQRLREAAKQRPAPFTNTGTGTMPTTTTQQQRQQQQQTKKPAAVAFDFDSFLGPLQKNKQQGTNSAVRGNIESAAMASLLGAAPAAGPSTLLPPPVHVPPPPVHIQPETEGGAELDAAMNQVSSLLDRMKGRGGGGLGGGMLPGNGIGSGPSSQLEMPPPPARGGRRDTIQEEGGSEEIGVGGARGKRRRRSQGEDSFGAAPRRSGRSRGGMSGLSELMDSDGIEMSQQVGYESAAVEVVEVSKDGHVAAAAAAVAKERLTRAATRNRRGGTNSRDILDGF